MFRAPSLRNVTVKRRFFHNGVMHSLKDVLRFYVERDLHPEKWYPRASDGSVRKFDDLPAQYHGNVNMDPPFGEHRAGGPALSEAEMDDVIAFLGTLKDGYRAR
jgi:cytochrome c peroxidase